MEKIKILLSGFLLLFSYTLFACSPSLQVPSVPSEKQCTTDADCVPAQCCHPTDAVNKEYAPDCSEIFCTMECAPNTLDCGQGEVKCVDTQCRVQLSTEQNAESS